MTTMAPADVHRAYESAVNAGNPDALLALYDNDAVLVGESGAEAIGRDAIRVALLELFAIDGHMRIETLAAVEAGDIALLKSHWELEGTAPDGSHVALSSNGSEVVRCDPNGRWKFITDHPWAMAPVTA